MTKRITKLAAVGLVVSAPMWADMFGGDIPILTGILAQATAAVQQAQSLWTLEKETQQQVTQAAMFVSHPQSWRSYLTTAQNALNTVSTGSDLAALQRLTQTLRATQEAYAQLSAQQMTTGNMAAMSQLSIQQAQLKQQADELNTHLQFGAAQDQYAQAGEGKIRMSDSLQRVMR